jgi:hypothetical protein
MEQQCSGSRTGATGFMALHGCGSRTGATGIMAVQCQTPRSCVRERGTARPLPSVPTCGDSPTGQGWLSPPAGTLDEGEGIHSAPRLRFTHRRYGIHGAPRLRFANRTTEAWRYTAAVHEPKCKAESSTSSSARCGGLNRRAHASGLRRFATPDPRPPTPDPRPSQV